LSPSVIGLEAPKPGSGVFHTTFSLALQVTGVSLSLATPVASGPRNRVQSAPASSTIDTEMSMDVRNGM
jgi:hypothetical protein